MCTEGERRTGQQEERGDRERKKERVRVVKKIMFLLLYIIYTTS